MINRSWASAAVGLGACLSAAWLGCSLDEAPFPGPARLTGSGGSAGGDPSTGTDPLRPACTGDLDCGAGRYCDAGVCRPKGTNGEPCATGGSTCVSGHCVDGVCCETSCDGLCQSCSAADNEAGVNGTCGDIAAGKDPEDECADSLVCAGGGCKKPNGAVCQAGDNGSDCASGHCTGGVCCDSACSGSCETCLAGEMSAGGVTGVCAPVANGKTKDQCDGAHACDGARGCRLVLGKPCGVDGTLCISGYCMDGVCCDGSCGGLCVSCAQPGASGRCLALPGGAIDLGCSESSKVCQDPANACVDRFKNGEICSSADVCASGACALTSPVHTCRQANGTQCASPSDCCSGLCDQNQCKPSGDPDPLCDGDPATN